MLYCLLFINITDPDMEPANKTGTANSVAAEEGEVCP